MIKAFPRHGIKLGYCVNGQKYACELHNIDFKDFVKNGIDVEKLLVLKDEMANRMVEQAIKEAGENGRRR